MLCDIFLVPLRDIHIVWQCSACDTHNLTAQLLPGTSLDTAAAYINRGLMLNFVANIVV